jgi:thiol:disulfide interchange protein DsbA
MLAPVLAWIPAPLLLAQGRAGNGAYRRLAHPQPVQSPGKIEVIEFFWYGCIHCYRFAAWIEAWRAKVPSDVAFVRIPAVFNDRWALDAALYYALDSSGHIERLHRPLLNAIHEDRLRTDDAHALARWLDRNGLDAAAIQAAMRSFSVQTQVRKAARASIAYEVPGTPAMAVQGRYVVTTEGLPQLKDMLAVVDRLVEDVRRGTG